jgi:uncharacterized membrane protein YjgN (DUF898 family)
MFWVMMGVIVIILCTGLITLRAAIRSNRLKYGKTYIKLSSIEKYMESVFIICKLCVFNSLLWGDVLD